MNKGNRNKAVKYNPNKYNAPWVPYNPAGHKGNAGNQLVPYGLAADQNINNDNHLAPYGFPAPVELIQRGGGWHGKASGDVVMIERIRFREDGRAVEATRTTTFREPPAADVIPVRCSYAYSSSSGRNGSSPRSAAYSRDRLRGLSWQKAVDLFRQEFTSLVYTPPANIRLEGRFIGRDDEWVGIPQSEFDRLIRSVTELRIMVRRSDGSWE